VPAVISRIFKASIVLEAEPGDNIIFLKKKRPFIVMPRTGTHVLHRSGPFVEL